MGGQQSTPAGRAAHEKAVIKRLEQLRVEEQDDYVEITGAQEKQACGFDKALRKPEGLPVSVLESWQSAVLKDPKNRYIHSPLISSEGLYAILYHMLTSIIDLPLRLSMQTTPRRSYFSPQPKSQHLRSSTSKSQMKVPQSQTSIVLDVVGSLRRPTSSASR